MLRRCTHAVRRSKSFGIVILSEESAAIADSQPKHLAFPFFD